MGLMSEHQYQKELEKIEMEQKIKERLNDVFYKNLIFIILNLLQMVTYNQYLDYKKKEKQEN